MIGRARRPLHCRSTPVALLSPSRCPRAGPCEERAAPDTPVLIETAGDACRGEVQAGPTAPHRHTGSRRLPAGVGRRRRSTRAAQPATAAARLRTRGRGSEGEEGRRSPPGSAAGAQPRRSPVRRSALQLRARAAQAGAPTRSFVAGPSVAGTLGGRHDPDLGHAPFWICMFQC
ncbi:hypothetical protein NDU88_003137 [Pleurodeles waltl]|uniref:Uncharacterized protein n=1 Tax=Pleurodeles waltl TaxID=8319 RepID=A0AAV7LEG9_PLEWA|nr:hypothetical protein NDU88_003137 [Pleurodeles waltl]